RRGWWWAAEHSVACKCSVSARPSPPPLRAMRTIRSTDIGSNLKCLDIFGCEWVSIRFKTVRLLSEFIHNHPQPSTVQNHHQPEAKRPCSRAPAQRTQYIVACVLQDRK